MNDDELMELFSAFDDVSASESLQSSTLDFIMSAAAAAPETTTAEAPASHAQTVTATRGGKARIRSQWRAIRTAAVAACLALALTGGAAYAYPASTVLVTQGETTIELHVNVFGQVLSVSASDDETQDIIDQLGLVHTQYSDSVTRVSDSLKESNPQVPIEIVMNGVPQEVESILEESSAQGESNEQNESSSNLLATGDSATLKAEAPVIVVDEPAVVAPVVSTVRMETPVFLPEPVYDEDESSSSSASENERRTPSRETDSSADDSADTDTDSDDGDNTTDNIIEEVVQPEQPVVIDEPDDVQDIDEPSDGEAAASDSQESIEVDYGSVRPPSYHGDDD